MNKQQEKQLIARIVEHLNDEKNIVKVVLFDEKVYNTLFIKRISKDTLSVHNPYYGNETNLHVNNVEDVLYNRRVAIGMFPQYYDEAPFKEETTEFLNEDSDIPDLKGVDWLFIEE